MVNSCAVQDRGRPCARNWPPSVGESVPVIRQLLGKHLGSSR